MRSSNIALRTKYTELLDSTITYAGVPVPAFFAFKPDDIEVKNYIIFGQINNNDTSTKDTSDTSTTIQVTIFTFDEKGNDGEAVDAIANEVLQIIYPDRHNRLDLSTGNLQVTNTELSNDFTQDYGQQADRLYLDRTITFRHTIYQQAL
jgi:hypothetical protein